MEENWQARQISLIGEENNEKLKNSSVLVFGAGGVGSYAIEGLARAGIGKISVVDCDKVSVTNINRQLIADTETVGRYKTEIEKERIGRINPNSTVLTFTEFANEENADRIIEEANPDFIVDCIDSVRSKIAIISVATEKGIKVISCMGTGNKLDPERLKIADISKTDTCPLAKAVRLGLREKGINHLPTVFSDEKPVRTGERTPASVSFVPPVAGMLLCGYVVRNLIFPDKGE